MRIFLLIFIALSIAGCARVPHNVVPTATRTVENRQLSAFTKIVVKGNIDLILHTGYARPKIILHGDARDLAKVVSTIKNNSLLVQMADGYPRYGEVSAEIRTHRLNAFNYTGSGIIRGNHLHSSFLDLAIDNNRSTTLAGSLVLHQVALRGGGLVQINGIIGHTFLQLSVAGKTRVQLGGVIDIAKILMEDDSSLSMYWVKSSMITVRAKDNAFIQLAGVASKLDVNLCDAAHFSGRYLRAKRAYVKTHDNAIAHLTALEHQHSLATDASDIYFYQIPTTKSDFMAFDGSVLNMREWQRYDFRDYDRYNK